jgi:hypothetical protein
LDLEPLLQLILAKCVSATGSVSRSKSSGAPAAQVPAVAAKDNFDTFGDIRSQHSRNIPANAIPQCPAGMGDFSLLRR